jgi:RNA ligase
MPDAIRWQDVRKVGIKRDGSMITPFLDPKTGKLRCKTKKSTVTKEALAALDLLKANTEQCLWTKNLLKSGYTPIFEITSPRFPIVLLYEKEELTLLHVRHMEQGIYLTDEEIKFLNPPFAVVPDLSDQFKDATGRVSWALLHEAAKHTTDTEGWIVQTAKDMYKVKTQWYIDLHHSVTFIRWRDVARVVLSESADDLKANFKLTGRDTSCIDQVQAFINDELTYVKEQVAIKVLEARTKSMTFKEMALAWRDHPLFNLIMATSRGAAVDYNEWYERRHISSWSLEVIMSDGAFVEPTTRERHVHNHPAVSQPK